MICAEKTQLSTALLRDQRPANGRKSSGYHQWQSIAHDDTALSSAWFSPPDEMSITAAIARIGKNISLGGGNMRRVLSVVIGTYVLWRGDRGGYPQAE